MIRSAFILGRLPRRQTLAVQTAVAAFLVFAITANSQAHFIWADFISTGDSRAEALIYFSEEPAPGERHLIDKVAQTQAWTRTAAGQITELTLTETAADRPAALAAACEAKDVLSVEATCDYGVLQRGPKSMLLQYYAKHLADDWPQRVDRASAGRLRLDFLPRLADGKLEVLLLFNGQPDADRELVVIPPQGEHRTLKTDAEGRAAWDATPGRWGVRAAHIDANQSGERDGKSYGQVSHYSTLTLSVPARAVSPPSASTAANAPSAAEILKRAREARAVWKDFPGFDALALISSDDNRIAAKVSIEANGTVTVDAPASPLREWADEQLSSLVQHRMPAGEIGDGNVRFGDDEPSSQDQVHPLGRRIDLGDANHLSVYRVSGDVITEVNRTMGQTRFTISMLETTWTPEKKYLPRAFTMSFFDAATGELKRNLSYWNDWRRLGEFDLPKTILEISARDGKTTTRRIELNEVRLRSK